MAQNSSTDYSVRWTQHMNNVRDICGSLLLTDELVDVTFYCEGRKLGAHKLLLSASSSYFRALFKDVAAPHPIIILNDISYAVMVDILHFIYTGEVTFDKNKLDAFVNAARSLKVAGIMNIRGTREEFPNEQTQKPEDPLLPPPEERVPLPTVDLNFIPSASPPPCKVAKIASLYLEAPASTAKDVDHLDSENFLMADVKAEPNEQFTFEDQDLVDPLQEDFNSLDAGQYSKSSLDWVGSNLPPDCPYVLNRVEQVKPNWELMWREMKHANEATAIQRGMTGMQSPFFGEKSVVKRLWSQEEKDAVRTCFRININEGIVPRKEDCQSCIKDNEVLASRRWTDIKFHVKNEISKHRRKLSHHFEN